MRNLGLLVVMVVGFSNAARAQGVDEPFYAAFKTLCADTMATPDLVKAAVEALPLAMPHSPPGASTTVPYPMTVAGWNINWNGHKFAVASGISRSPNGPGQVIDSISCTISSNANEDAGVAAIRKWVGIQPDPYSSTGLTYYDYREDGSARRAIIGDAESKSAMGEGKAWLLTVQQQPNFALVQLMHFKAPIPRN